MNPVPRPFEHRPWELAAMRAALALLLLWSLRSNWPGFDSMPKPHGLGRWIDFSFFGDPAALGVLSGVYMAALVCYAAGVLHVPALGYMVFFTVGSGTLMNSQGSIGHSTQLAAMVVLAQFLVHLVCAIAESRSNPRALLFASWKSSAAAADWSRNVIAAGYVVCAVTKLVRTGGTWILRTPNLSLQLIKNNEMHHFNRLQEPSGFWMKDVPEFLVAHPWIAMAVFGTGLLLELFAFLMLINKRWAFFGGLALIGLHLSILEMLRLNFEEHMGLLGIYFVAPLLMEWAGRGKSRAAARGEAGASCERRQRWQ